MSLLMDALKKAEQEKKAAANRLEETQVHSSTDTDNSDDEVISKEITDEHKRPITELGSQGGGDPINDFASTAQLSLAPIERAEKEESSFPEINLDDTSSEDLILNITAADLNIEQTPQTQDGLEGDGADEQHEPTLAEELQGDAVTSFDETFHGVSLGDEDPELFQETMQGEAYIPEDGKDPYEETLPGVSAAQFAEDIGSEDLPTPVAAQTVFTATNTVNKASSGYKWLLIGSTVLAIIAAGIWYYYTVTPMNRVLPSPQVARGIERIIPVPSQVEAPEDAISGSLRSTDASNVDVLEEAESIEEEEVPELAPEMLADDSITIASNEEREQTQIDMEKETQESSAEGEEEMLLPGAQRPGLVREVEHTSALFKISRSKRTNDKSEAINNAYSAYKEGQFQTAKNMYTEILKEFPNNRDALLGLGAIALNSGETRQAYMFYSQILRFNPQDNIARTTLINLQGEAEPLKSISTIKSMLYESPEQPILYFTLGNLYAKQSRWAEAQQSFFDAYRLDLLNPNYAFNLAISLDQLGQYKTALDYYNVALKLTDETAVSFDPAAVMKRISDLTARN